MGLEYKVICQNILEMAGHGTHVLPLLNLDVVGQWYSLITKIQDTRYFIALDL